MTAPTASVVVRSYNEESTIEAALTSLRRQTVPVEIVQVDSGSEDSTLARAAPYTDVLVQIPPSDFSFGGALNLGTERASGNVLFALSAHCQAEDPKWVENSLAHYADPRVAGTCGWVLDPSGAPFLDYRPITFADIRIDPHTGFSNHGSSWRREAWEQVRFDASLQACEDAQWQWRVMLAGWRVIADPDLVIPTDHRRDAGPLALWRREYREHQAIAELLDYPTMSGGELARAWWGRFPWPSRYPKWARRLSPSRNVELLAGYLGDRSGRARRGPHTIVLPAEVTPA